MSARRRPRGYSQDFPVAPTAKRRQFNIDKVPPDLHRAVFAKAKRDGISIRALVLRYLQEWSGAEDQSAAVKDALVRLTEAVRQASDEPSAAAQDDLRVLMGRLEAAIVDLERQTGGAS